MSPRLLVWLFAIVCASGACSAPGNPETDSRPAQSAPVDEPLPGQMVTVSVSPVVFDGEGLPWGKELLRDPGFERFTMAQALKPAWAADGWHAEPSQDAAECVSLDRAPDSPNGKTVLRIAPSGGEVVVSQRTAGLGSLPPGTWLHATARVRASTRQSLGLVVSLKAGGKEIAVGEGCRGDGGWESVETAFPLPASLEPGEFVLSLVRRTGAVDPVWVFEASLHVMDGPQSVPGAAGELLTNPSFERYAFVGTPYPWRKEQWNSLGGPVGGGDVSVIALGEGPDAGQALRLSCPDENNAIRISQHAMALAELRPETRLVAVLRGLAHAESDLWLSIRFVKDGKDMRQENPFATHPGDGKWHEIEIERGIAAGPAPDEVWVDVLRRSFSREPVLVDWVSLKQKE